MPQHWEIVSGGNIVVSNTAEGLWHNACKYFQWCDENPIVTSKTIMTGKEAGREIKNSSIRPYSIKGLCLHCGILEEYMRDIRASKDEGSMYYNVVSKILYLIYIQNLEMAMIGEYSPVFATKVLGMEKEEVPTGAITVNVVPGLPELSKSENEILKKLELENRDLEKRDL